MIWWCRVDDDYDKFAAVVVVSVSIGGVGSGWVDFGIGLGGG